MERSCKWVLLVLAWWCTMQGLSPIQAQVLWRDDFKPCATGCTNGGIRGASWTFELGDGSDNDIVGWGNNEQECYRNTSAVARVIYDPTTKGNGLLVIQASKLEPFACANKLKPPTTKSWQSARLVTRNKRTFMWKQVNSSCHQPLVVEARLSFTPGTAFWPAFWMLPQPPSGPCDFKCNGAYGIWPRSGEIDIVEMINKMDWSVATIHYTNASGSWQFSSGGKTMPNPTAFHTYGIKWGPTSITWYLDGVQIYQVSNTVYNKWYTNQGFSSAAPFDKPFYVLLNFAVGGYWPGYPDSTTPSTGNMTVDWVQAKLDTAVCNPKASVVVV